jgi:hypothetical protein
MKEMKTRLPLHLAALSAALAVLALVPGLASAQIVELGATTTPLSAPACIKGQPLSQCTIVAFTVGLSRLSSSRSTEASIIKSQDAQHGGAPQLALTVLKPGPGNTFTVESESAIYTLTPFLGQVLQEPLSLPPSFTSLTALHVVRGDVIGLTVPTWAPVLGYDLSKTMFSYRQSRRANCANTAATQTAQTRAGESQAYGCYYTGTRVEYSATEVTDTQPPKTYIGDSARR